MEKEEKSLKSRKLIRENANVDGVDSSPKAADRLFLFDVLFQKVWKIRINCDFKYEEIQSYLFHVCFEEIMRVLGADRTDTQIHFPSLQSTIRPYSLSPLSVQFQRKLSSHSKFRTSSSSKSVPHHHNTCLVSSVYPLCLSKALNAPSVAFTPISPST